MITIHYLLLAACLTASAISGFFAGRLRSAGDDEEKQEEAPAKERERHTEKDGSGWSVGSPVSGQAAVLQEGPEAEIVIQPAEDRLYAPVSGKITKLYPMGNAFRFHTEFGAELYIQAGDAQDDMLGRYYRPRIVQNEIVSKGKLLLEFDRQGLAAEGASAEVSVRVDNHIYGSEVVATAEGPVRTGEEILWMQDRDEHSEPRRGRKSVQSFPGKALMKSLLP